MQHKAAAGSARNTIGFNFFGILKSQAAEGGNNAKTAADITDAVVALFGIEVHKIKVMKKV